MLPVHFSLLHLNNRTTNSKALFCNSVPPRQLSAEFTWSQTCSAIRPRSTAFRIIYSVLFFSSHSLTQHSNSLIRSYFCSPRLKHLRHTPVPQTPRTFPTYLTVLRAWITIMTSRSNASSSSDRRRRLMPLESAVHIPAMPPVNPSMDAIKRAQDPRTTYESTRPQPATHRSYTLSSDERYSGSPSLKTMKKKKHDEK